MYVATVLFYYYYKVQRCTELNLNVRFLASDFDVVGRCSNFGTDGMSQQIFCRVVHFCDKGAKQTLREDQTEVDTPTKRILKYFIIGL